MLRKNRDIGDLAQKNADTYSMNSVHTAATSSTPQPSALSDDSESSSLAAAYPRWSKYYFCGGSYIIIGEFSSS